MTNSLQLSPRHVSTAYVRLLTRKSEYKTSKNKIKIEAEKGLGIQSQNDSFR